MILALSHKLAMKLALATCLITSEPASIDLVLITISDVGTKFSLSKPRKSQYSGGLKVMSSKWYQDRPLLCPVNCLATEVAITQFACIIKQEPIITATLERWIKTCTSEAGINVDVFSANSTRGVGASTALSVGTPLETILKTAGWSSESTFHRFYHRTPGQQMGNLADRNFFDVLE